MLREPWATSRERLTAESFRLSTEVLLLCANDWQRQLPACHKSLGHQRCYFNCCTLKVTGGRRAGKAAVLWKASPWKDFLKALAAHERKKQGSLHPWWTHSSLTRSPVFSLDIRSVSKWINARTRTSSWASQPGGQTSPMRLFDTVTC